MNKYFNYKVQKAVVVQDLITIEVLDTSALFSYPEEEHEFYEFVYTDIGGINCTLQNQKIKLEQGDFLLIPPNEKHFYSAIKNTSASIFIVCFSSQSEILSILDKKIKLDSKNKSLLLELLKEAKKAFNFPFDKKLQALQSPVFGSQQLVENKIEELLIILIREKLAENSNIKLVLNSAELENNLVNDVINVLKEKLYENTSLNEVCDLTHYSKTYLNALFKKNTGYTIIQYFIELKVQEAKKLLRENYSTADISIMLQFDSPSYFSKVFKKHTNLTPSQYKKTIL